MKRRALGIVLSCASLALVSSVVISATLALYVKDASSGGSYGEIALRSYYERGSGSQEDPFVITRPRHMYNFARLQGLGVYGEKKYFQLGMVGLGGDTSGEPRCYLGDGSNTVVPFLDMSGTDYHINAIGSESVPFYGQFEGNNLEIKNLTLYADPEDAGLFGYTAHSSVVKNLFLDNIDIRTMGYTDAYANLYSAGSTLSQGVTFLYDPNPAIADDSIEFTVSSADYGYASFSAESAESFVYDDSGTIPEITGRVDKRSGSSILASTTITPALVNAGINFDGYKYKTLVSGDFIKPNASGSAWVPDMAEVFAFFAEKRTPTETYTPTYPMTASTALSVMASQVDPQGLEHTKVLLSVEFYFTLESGNATTITMETRPGSSHSNNVGLIIGHCDGSVANVYVHDGSFHLNSGDDSTYHAMEHRSSLGLVGLVGNTVHNKIAEESDGTAAAGKDVGVLDFTTVYDDIITASSFTGEGGQSVASGGVTYVPNGSTKYLDYLRNNGSNYVTRDTSSVSLRQYRVVRSSDLGVFTIASDYSGTGTAKEASLNLDHSVIASEDLAVDGNYYLYYTTGEYDRTSPYTFIQYRDAFNSDTNNRILLGHHFPSADQIHHASFPYRDWNANYFVRFALDPGNRGSGFYFSDVDTATPGGAYMANYFRSKLVDQNGDPIAIGTPKSGVMLKNSFGREISSFSASFATPDISQWGRMYCLDQEEEAGTVHYAANMVNFEVKTETANVTVVAAQVDTSKACALGVYKLGEDEYATDTGVTYYTRSFDDPDYAFFMPTDANLAYFDYKVENKIGKIGTYDTSGNFTEATVSSEATVPSTYGRSGEYGFASGKPRLFCHTFKLSRGRYCIGSPTGTSTGLGQGIAKVYYLCAQGQTDGQIQIEDNVYREVDVAQEVDFLKKPRFTYVDGTTTTNVTLGDIETYDAADPRLPNQRCYALFVDSDPSIFAVKEGDIAFAYEDGMLKITSSDLSAMTHVAVTNFGSTIEGKGIPNSTVSLFGNASQEDLLTYSYSG